MADSVCGQLDRFSREHRFVVVLSRFLDKTAERIKDYDNVEVLRYDLPHSFRSVVLGRDKFLDGLVKERMVDAVLTVFGPSLWRPRVPHLCGFARAQLLLKDSPYFDSHFRVNDSWLKKLKERIIQQLGTFLLGVEIKTEWFHTHYLNVHTSFDQPEEEITKPEGFVFTFGLNI